MELFFRCSLRNPYIWDLRFWVDIGKMFSIYMENFIDFETIFKGKFEMNVHESTKFSAARPKVTFIVILQM